MDTKLYKIYHKNTSPQLKVISKNNFTYRNIISTIEKYLKPKDSILDIGCGAGTLLFYFAKKGYSVFGIDIADNAINACRKSAKTLKLKNYSFESYVFPKSVPNKKFDFIILTEVIEHLPDDSLALKKIYKLLNPGGIVFITTPSKNAPLYRLGLADNFDKRVGHLRRYTLEELVGKSEKAGFTILDTKKTEGIIRNFLYINPVAGKAIRFIKYFLVSPVLYIDYISLLLFGESDLYVVAKK